jgi:hypothetical protein
MRITVGDLRDIITEASPGGNRYMIRPGIDVLVKQDDSSKGGWRLHRLKKVTYFTDAEVKGKPEGTNGHWTFSRKGWLLSVPPFQLIDLTRNWNEPPGVT